MKGLIILAVTSFLVGIKTSSISTVQKELEDVDESKKVKLLWTLEEQDVGTEVNNGAADDTSAHGVLDVIQKIETIVDVLHFLQNHKNVMGCSGNTCEWCKWSAKDFKYCKKIKWNLSTLKSALNPRM